MPSTPTPRQHFKQQAAQLGEKFNRQRAHYWSMVYNIYNRGNNGENIFIDERNTTYLWNSTYPDHLTEKDYTCLKSS